ncbi:MAG: adenylate kinase [Candidatus Jordarchaeales archaeon]
MSRKGAVVVVTGVPGVGKTTVIDNAIEAARKEGMKITLMNYGTVMLEIAKAKGLVENRDQMRKLPSNIQREVQKLAAEKIADAAKDGIVVVDTHMLINTPEGFLPGIPAWVAESLKPNVLILIEADPEEIKNRRRGDESRERDVQSVEEIRLHQEMCRSTAAACATLTGATIVIVPNREGKVSEAAEKILKVFRGIATKTSEGG